MWARHVLNITSAIFCLIIFKYSVAAETQRSFTGTVLYFYYFMLQITAVVSEEFAFSCHFCLFFLIGIQLPSLYGETVNGMLGVLIDTPS